MAGFFEGMIESVLHIFRALETLFKYVLDWFSYLGQLTTYNFHNPKKSAHLDKQDYQMCIRRELGNFFGFYRNSIWYRAAGMCLWFMKMTLVFPIFWHISRPYSNQG